jgi:hypothetical protein
MTLRYNLTCECNRILQRQCYVLFINILFCHFDRRLCLLPYENLLVRNKSSESIQRTQKTLKTKILVDVLRYRESVKSHETERQQHLFQSEEGHHTSQKITLQGQYTSRYGSCY